MLVLLKSVCELILLKNRTPALAPTIRLMIRSQISKDGKGFQGPVFVMCAGDKCVMVPC